jgi:hypothetical protein
VLPHNRLVPLLHPWKADNDRLAANRTAVPCRVDDVCN